MRGSLKLFTWFGIPVALHWSFSLIFVYALWVGYEENRTPVGIAWLMIFFLALFACVLLHEYGHALTARRFGVQTQEIILTPVGGVAFLERMPEKPTQEFLVAIGGPLVNVVIAILLLGINWFLFEGSSFESFGAFFEHQFSMYSENQEGLPFLMPALLVMNIILVVFNMIPAFPMDGGRVFRALLSIPIGRLRATKVASIAGQVISVLFVFYGFYIGAYTLAIIGFYIFSMARAENNMVQLDSVLKRYTAADLLRTQFTRLSSNDWIQTPIELLRHGLERNFLVFDINDQLVGVLDEAALIDAMQKRDLSTEISRYMRPVQMVQTTESLQNIYQLLRTDQGILAVINNHELIGVVDQDGLRNFMRLEGK